MSICLGSCTWRYSYSSSEYLLTMLAGAPARPRVNNTPCRVVNRVNKLVQLLFLVLRQWARLLVAAREIDIHIGRHFEGRNARGRSSCARAIDLTRVNVVGQRRGFDQRRGAVVARLVMLCLCDDGGTLKLVEREKGFKRARTTNSCLQ